MAMKVIQRVRKKAEQNEQSFSADSDEVLVALLLNDDFWAYGRLIRKYQDLIKKTAWALTEDRKTANALTIVAMMAVWADRKVMDNSIPLRHFLADLVSRLYARGYPYLSDN
jgi:hypothetical protein